MISSALFKGVVMILGPHLSISGGFLSWENKDLTLSQHGPVFRETPEVAY